MEIKTNVPERSFAQRMDKRNSEIELRKLWQSLWHRKWRIVLITLVAMLIAALAVFNMTPIYRAVATLLIEQQSARVLSIEQIYGQESKSNEYLQTQFELLKSHSLAERVVRQLGLTEHPEFDPRQRSEPLISSTISKLLASLGLGKQETANPLETLAESGLSNEAKVLESVTRRFITAINVVPVGRSQLVKIEVNMADRHMAARAANALAEGFIESQMEANMEISATAASWMNSRLVELRETLRAAEDKLQAFREQENLVDVGGVATIAAAELSKTGDRMIDARSGRSEAESQYRQVQNMRSGGWEKLASLPAVLGHPLIQQFKSEQARAQAKVDELSKRYGPRHPNMLAAQSDLSAAQASLRGQVEQVVAGIERNYQLAVANERSLRQSFEDNRSQIQEIARKEFQLRELQREVDTNRVLYDTFLNRLKETTATADLEASNARLVDRAVAPLFPDKPKKPLIIAVAGLLAGFIAAGLVLLLNALNNTFKGTEEIESHLNLPVLGIVPLLKGKKPKELARQFASNTDKAFSESIRTIRTSVMLSGMDGSKKIMVVTSSVPREGKTTVASNLAIALGQIKKVILIDADMRRPTLAKKLNLPPETPGLANLIAGTAKIEDAIQQVEGIDVITAGDAPHDPLELLSSPHYAKLLEYLTSKYQHVIIDSPPIQAVSDAKVLSTHADSLIYVIRSDHTAIAQVERGLDALLQSNAPVTGIVLSQADVRKAQKYGYSYGGYYDYYGYSDNKNVST